MIVRRLTLLLPLVLGLAIVVPAQAAQPIRAAVQRNDEITFSYEPYPTALALALC